VTDRFRVAHISELEISTSSSGARWAPVRMSFGINAFGINANRATEAGQEIISEHDEIGPRSGRHEEVYFVAAGHAMFTVEGDEVDAPAGTFVFVRDPAAKRKAVAREEGTTIVVAGGAPGQAFEPAPWERASRSLRHWQTQDWDAAIAELTEAHEQYPDDATVLYNLACAEGLAGRREHALTHLRQSIELDTSFAELAAEDDDFAAIRDDPEFSAVTRQADGAGSSS
jgi:tetratricopeptide (TPR) repeat protein